MKKRLHPWLRTLRKYFIPHRHNRYHPHVLHTKHVLGFGALFTAMKVGLVAFALIIPAEAFVTPDVLAEQGSKILALTNHVRQEHGLSALSEVVVLNRSAQAKADDMNAAQYFSHVAPNGRGLNYFLSSKGYSYVTAGENLAVGFSDADSVVQAWMKSPTHLANLIDQDFKQVGIGMIGGVYQGKPTVFVAQHFGVPMPKDAPVEPTKEPELRLSKAPEVRSSSTYAIAAVTPPKVKPVEVKPKAVAPKPVIRQVAAVPVPVPAATPTPTRVPVKSAPAVEQPVAIPAEPVAPTPVPVEEADPFVYKSSASYVAWSESGKQTRLEVRASLQGPVQSVKAMVESYQIPLRREADGLYRGTLTVPESSDELFRVIIAPSLVVELNDGRTVTEVIDWRAPKVVSQTPLQRYIQVNSWLGGSIPVYVIAHYIYLFALFFFASALILNIVIEIRRQHPHVIMQTLALIALLFVYVKF